MNSFFGYDSLIFRICDKLVKYIYVSVLWLVFSIPILSIGASTTALYTTVFKVIRKDRGKIWETFWEAFKENFKQSTIMWLIMLFCYFIFAVDVYVFVLYYLNHLLPKFVLIVAVVMVIWGFAITLYILPYISRFQNTIRGILWNCGRMCFQNLLFSVTLVALLILTMLCVAFLPISVLLIPGIGMNLSSIIFEVVFRKCMTPEDIKAEEKRYTDEEDL